MPHRIHRRLSPVLGAFALAVAGLACSNSSAATLAFPSPGAAPTTPAAQREEALRSIPFEKLTAHASSEIRSIAERPTLYRRLPSQSIDCDPRMFLFLVRHPEVIVGIWKKMDISQVSTQRVGPYQLMADDRAGTKCKIDLVYGDNGLHIFVATGSYSGPLAPRPITGSGLFILRSGYAKGSSDRTTVNGTLDCFIQLDSLGADLLARTLSRLIGNTADHNFIETARFISQISQAAERNPTGLRDIAVDLNDIELPTRQRFIATIKDVYQRRTPQSADRQRTSYEGQRR